MTAPLVRVQDFHKTYEVGFLRKKVEAVRGISFTVESGEIVGLIGPNGSGKTTTIKCLMGLCAPSSGSLEIRGLPAAEPAARERIGFLPENPYVYPYLTPREFVDLCARLSGVPGGERATRTAEVIERVGITYAADRPVGKLSKGMLQRTGLAAALVADPELLVLDEPMSGLDPLGRREVRDLVFEERRRGRTVLFSSHVLSDVEALCDRVVILHKGVVAERGTIRELVNRSATITELTLRGGDAAARGAVASHGAVLRELDQEMVLEVEGEVELNAALATALERGVQVVSAVPRKDSLEDLFVRKALGTADAAS